MYRTFKRSWRYHDKDFGSDRIIPAGWQGELPDAVAKAADTDGVTLLEKVKEPAKPSAELSAARKAVSDAEKAVKAAKSPDEKAKADADYEAAQQALADLAA